MVGCASSYIAQFNRYAYDAGIDLENRTYAAYKQNLTIKS